MSGRGKAAVAAAAVVFTAGAGFAATQLLPGRGSHGTTSVTTSAADAGTAPDPSADPAATGTAFLRAWAARDYDAMQNLVADPTDDMTRVYGGLARRLKVSRVAVAPGTLDAGHTLLPYTATLTVAGRPWTYRGAVPLTRTASGWRVAFTSGTVYPGLANGQTLALASSSAPVRLLDRTGKDLASDEDLDVNLLGQQGVSGLRRVVAGRTATGPLQLVVRNATSGETVSVLEEWTPAKAAAGVRTTISLPVQLAAERALRAVPGRAALVALDVPTGEVRALANKPTSGIPPALTPYAPGSTFKIITAAAALENSGVTPASRIACPSSTVVNGRTIHNHEKAELGTVSLTTAFAQSCNTAFALLGARLPAGALAATAARFGFGGDDLLPVTSPAGSLPPPSNPAQVVEDSIGQGAVTASPLAMAAVAAAVGAGTWHQPHVLPCPSCAGHPIPQAAALRTLMRAVVTSGTGTAAAGVPGGPVRGKTGTAEYGSGTVLPTHAWFVGWQGSTAFAVFAENGTSGGAVAAPAAARFLRAIG